MFSKNWIKSKTQVYNRLRSRISFLCFIFEVLLLNLIYASTFIISLWVISLFSSHQPYLFILIVYFIFLSLLIVKLWRINDAYKHLNDFCLFAYATYIAVSKLLPGINNDFPLPTNITWHELWNADNYFEYINLIVLIFIAICTTAKTIIAYLSFKIDYNKKKTDGIQILFIDIKKNLSQKHRDKKNDSDN
ncbi:hypothetical protein LD669_17190 [Salmonella enterica]|nr:hypothetical protein [Salmonella enterica]MDJ6959444.1 hypothetical protein [Salmonella enterica]MDJ7089856.1 hypothetical protein [Salmonella enterica]